MGCKLFKRIVSALLAIPLLFFVAFQNGFFIKILTPIFAFIAINEFFNAFYHIGVKPSKIIAFISIIIISMISFKGFTVESIMLWITLSMLCILIQNLFKKNVDIVSSGVTALGIYYIVFFIYHIVFLLDFQTRPFIWLVFITAWVTDTCAYFVGNFMGAKKLCPQISPKKTVEGAIGGIIGSVIACIIFAYFIMPKFLVHCILIGLIGSVLAQMGDLTASIFKRYTEIKDYGKIMPGHGGILDRFDSILFTAPAVYYYVIFLIR